MTTNYTHSNTTAPVALVPLQSQNLNRMLIGKWTIYKYQLNLQVPFLKSRIEFFSDGTFTSQGIYFGRKTGTFKTNQNKFTVITDTEEGIAEWYITFRGNHLYFKRGLTYKDNSMTLVKRTKTKQRSIGN